MRTFLRLSSLGLVLLLSAPSLAQPEALPDAADEGCPIDVAQEGHDRRSNSDAIDRGALAPRRGTDVDRSGDGSAGIRGFDDSAASSDRGSSEF